MSKISTLILFAAGCSSSGGDVITARQLPAAVKADATTIAQANNQFAFELYATVATGDGNAFLSPFSISTALAMVDAGAAGTTDQQIRAALHLDVPADRTHAAYGALLASVEIGRNHGAYTLDTANRLFGQQGRSFLPSYLAITGGDYGAPLVPVDFADHTEAARAAINAWVAQQTEDKVPTLYDPGTIAPSTVLALANAIVFKGTWAHAFDAGATADAAFQLTGGGTVQVPMMHTTDAIATASIPGGRIGILPFSGKDLSMVVVVPDQVDGLAAIEAQLTGNAIAQWIGSATLAAEPAEVVLPRFALGLKYDLKGPLGQLGITSAFDNRLADFSALDGQRDLYLDAVVHKATITVDEIGAEAAAATGATIRPTSVPAPLLVADHPFVFFIYDHVTGSVLFLGRIQDPTAA